MTVVSRHPISATPVNANAGLLKNGAMFLDMQDAQFGSLAIDDYRLSIGEDICCAPAQYEHRTDCYRRPSDDLPAGAEIVNVKEAIGSQPNSDALTVEVGRRRIRRKVLHIRVLWRLKPDTRSSKLDFSV